MGKWANELLVCDKTFLCGCVTCLSLIAGELSDAEERDGVGKTLVLWQASELEEVRGRDGV